jgi:adaptin ear-binding coat-associated protein 1/2
MAHPTSCHCNSRSRRNNSERNDAFDFNTSLEDARREKEAEQELKQAKKREKDEPAKDYTLKEGEKIHISVSKVAGRRSSTGANAPKENRRGSVGDTGSGGGFLKPPSRDTPRRASNR